MVSGFLSAAAEAVHRQRQDMAARAAGRPLVGLAWRSANMDYGAQKSLQLADLVPLLRKPACWIDLQYGDTAAERDALPADAALWHDPAVDPLRDADAAAAQIAALDLVITVSNTTAHLAGALGRPTWLLLPAPGYGLLWYWFLDRPDSLFYPSIRCFRQARAGDWGPALAQLEAALDAWLATKD